MPMPMLDDILVHTTTASLPVVHDVAGDMHPLPSSDDNDDDFELEEDTDKGSDEDNEDSYIDIG